MKAVSLTTILEDVPEVDFMHVDIQGSEADVLEAAAAALDEKVRRIHIGTHDCETEARLRALFGDSGWMNVSDYPGETENATPWGDIAFQDGVQTWVNPRLARAA